jgi:hypothetical protein
MRHNDPRKAPRGNCHLSQSSPESQLKCGDVLIGLSSLSIKNMVIMRCSWGYKVVV